MLPIAAAALEVVAMFVSAIVGMLLTRYFHLPKLRSAESFRIETTPVFQNKQQTRTMPKQSAAKAVCAYVGGEVVGGVIQCAADCVLPGSGTAAAVAYTVYDNTKRK